MLKGSVIMSTHLRTEFALYVIICCPGDPVYMNTKVERNAGFRFTALYTERMSILNSLHRLGQVSPFESLFLVSRILRNVSLSVSESVIPMYESTLISSSGASSMTKFSKWSKYRFCC